MAPYQLINIHQNETTSTLDLAHANADKLKPGEMRIYTADRQTQARGSHSRKWYSPPNLNIYPTYSFLVPETLFFKFLQVFPLIAGYSVVLMLKNFALNASLKWPNDILLNKKKMTGILCESHPQQDYRLINIGVGVNVNMSAQECSALDQPVTSMVIESGRVLIGEEVQEILTTILVNNLENFINNGFQLLYPQISDAIENFDGEEILFDPQEVGSPEGLFKGKILGINEKGLLCLKGVYLNRQNSEPQFKNFISGRILRAQPTYV